MQRATESEFEIGGEKERIRAIGKTNRVRKMKRERRKERKREGVKECIWGRTRVRRLGGERRRAPASTFCVLSLPLSLSLPLCLILPLSALPLLPAWEAGSICEYVHMHRIRSAVAVFRKQHPQTNCHCETFLVINPMLWP